MPLAVVAVAVCAGAATLLLRPRGGVIEPAAVEAQAYFSPAQLDRAEEYRGPQRLIGLGGLAVSGGVLALLALRPPRRVRRALERAGRRPVLGAAAAGAGLSVVLAAAGMPLAAISHERAADVGLATQDWPDWLFDVVRSAGIGAATAGVGAAVFLALIRRFPRNWWLPGSGVVVGFATLITWVGPVVLDPVWNDFERLPKGSLRSEVLDLAERSGVEVGEVYRVDASRRTSGANAYVNGLGATKRVVLYDNLIEDFPPGEVRSVVAHELGHVKERDLERGLLWLAIVAPAALLLIQRGSERLDRGRGDAGTPAMLPALALMLSLVTVGVTVASNGMSRRVEARADAFSIDVTADPRAHIGLERRLAVRNVSDPDPPAPWHRLFGTHPTTLERIGYGVARERELSGASGSGPSRR